MNSRKLFALVAIGMLVPGLAVDGPGRVAAGGGGCHEQHQTAGNGTEVRIEQNCFGPTTLTIAPGDRVTFVNAGEIPHNVRGLGWGSWDRGTDGVMQMGTSFVHVFDAPGIFPYACSLHPDMVGAIIVGDGVAPEVMDGGTPEGAIKGGSGPDWSGLAGSAAAGGAVVALGFVGGARLLRRRKPGR